jgi:ubiquinone/menaquinone biosynthesis C-methylase UbiE
MGSPALGQRYERLKQHYHSPEVAARYDARLFGNERFRRKNERQLAALGALLDHAAAAGHPVRRILDLPCGTGRLLPELARRQLETIGCDIALPMIEQATAKARALGARQAAFMLGDAEDLPFPDGHFDAVVSCRFLRHVPRATRIVLLREMRRVTRCWVIVDPRTAFHPQYVRRTLRGLLSLPWRLPNYGLTRRGLTAELRAAGLRLERIQHLQATGSPSYLALARRDG